MADTLMLFPNNFFYILFRLGARQHDLMAAFAAFNFKVHTDTPD